METEKNAIIIACVQVRSLLRPENRERVRSIGIEDQSTEEELTVQAHVRFRVCLRVSGSHT